MSVDREANKKRLRDYAASMRKAAADNEARSMRHHQDVMEEERLRRQLAEHYDELANNLDRMSDEAVEAVAVMSLRSVPVRF